MTDTELMNKILERLTRIETRLCRVMQYQGIDPDAGPPSQTLNGVFRMDDAYLTRPRHHVIHHSPVRAATRR